MSKGEALTGPERLWRYRVGGYRVVVAIEGQGVTVTVVRLGSRGQVSRA